MSDSKQPAQPADDRDQEIERDDAVIGRAFVRSGLVLAAAACMVAGAIWWANRKPPEEEVQVEKIGEAQFRRPTNASIPSVKFVDITDSAGLDFFLENGATGQKLLPETMCGGFAFFDFDGDLDADILCINAQRWPGDPRPPEEKPPTMGLYRNDGKGNFANVTAGSGLDVTFYGQGVAVGDYDNDGRADVFVSAVGRDRLFHNEGDGQFTETTDAAGVAGADGAWGTSCSFLDYDLDGDLDLFVANYIAWTRDIDLGLPCTLDAATRAYCRPMDFQGAFPYLYRNDGNGEFVDVSADSGVQTRNKDRDVPVSKSLGVAPVDVDADGWIDIIVANDTVQNLLFHNQRDGTFKEIGDLTSIAFDANGQARGAMGADAAYFRNDAAQLGVAIGNFANEQSALYVTRVGSDSEIRFTDVANATGLGGPSRSRLKFGIFFFDYDLDGRLDIFTANGHLENEIQKVQSSQTYEQQPHLFCNCGAKQRPEFALVAEDKCGADFARPMVGRGAGYADLDGDGDLDVLIMASRGKPRLLRNDQQLGRHYLRVKLTGKRATRDAIGAWIEAHVGNDVQKRQVMPTRSYLTQVELPVTFGLDQATQVDTLVIRWPGGGVQELTGVKADQLLVIEESTAN